ncbi:HPF/RaiA family ribosome-associated protein [Amycolatopsis mongoliensis]|uniref:HPF/RaiA family ribosome-associated protein n=1 Tax=Amycolatopsis mongoliensis TaxID=715475 RepID=A0A9Y2JKM6_9PSEU|nr:HPF/RaiA family ribosome-associated protein [Amycolatopsis sp. 4-36]WIX98593.1 HPF/RaiA family ribosome-associated protein [Amycolatopsis sp. 4-36]
MQIQISTDKNVHAGDALVRHLEDEIQATLARFTDRITRLDVHLGDEIAAGAEGVERRCVLEARPAGYRPVSVTHHAGSVAEACRGAVRKLESVLESTYGRAYHRKGGETIRHLRTTDEVSG